MFVIGKYLFSFREWTYLMNYRRTNDGATMDIGRAHKYKTAERAWKAAEAAGPGWDVYEV